MRSAIFIDLRIMEISSSESYEFRLRCIMWNNFSIELDLPKTEPALMRPRTLSKTIGTQS